MAALELMITLHPRVVAVCQKDEDRIHGMNTFYVLKLLGQIICNVMDHTILSIVIVYSFINNCMWLYD